MKLCRCPHLPPFKAPAPAFMMGLAIVVSISTASVRAQDSILVIVASA